MLESAVDYEWRVAHERAAKDAFFRTSPHSPIPAADRAGFDGLAYYPVDPAWRIERLRLQSPDDDALDRIEIATSEGGARVVRRLGTLSFVVGGQPRQLAAYELGRSDGSLFLPFLDATSGAETYGTGRYLDAEPEQDGTYVLDFNAAYHPHCAHAPDYSCPLTPAENRLPDRIEAGERLATAGVR